MADGPRITTDTFELLDGTPENTRKANDQFKDITKELKNQLEDRPHFDEFIWPSVGRKNSSPYTSRPNKQSGDYWKACWLGLAHHTYREEYERPQHGLQLQFFIRSYETLSPAGIALHLNSSAPPQPRSTVHSNLRDHKEEFIDHIQSLDEFEVELGGEEWTIGELKSNWEGFLDDLNSTLNILCPLTKEEVTELGERIVPKIVDLFDDLLPLYSLLSGIELNKPPYRPAIWIEKTAVEGRDYKQSGELALGNAIWSPQRDGGGRDNYRLMRHIQPGDIIVHYVKDDNQFEGISTVESELITDFVCPPDSQWGLEDEDRLGYRFNLTNYVGFDEPVSIDRILDDEEYTDQLKQIREDNEHLFYSQYGDSFRPGEGGYLTRVPNELAEILSQTSEELDSELSNRGYRTGGLVIEPEELGNNLLANIGSDELQPDLYRVALSHLISGKNVVFYGPPGTGKTRAAQRLSEAICHESNLETANAEWTNYELIGGPKPPDWDDDPGFFTSVAQRCADRIGTESRPSWLIIDELNRANLDQAFGEVFTLLDLDYRGERPLPVNDTFVPMSFRLLATMNTYDKAQLFTLGYAFMRRFAFIKVPSLLKESDHTELVTVDENIDLDTLSLSERTQEIEDIITKAIQDHFSGSKYDYHYNSDSAIIFSHLEDQLDIQMILEEVLNDKRLQSNGYNFIEVLLLFAQEVTSRNIVEIGQALIIDAAKYVVAYATLFPERRDVSVIDEAVVSYILPQFDYYMPKLRKASTMGGDGNAEKRLDEIISIAHKLGFSGTARKLLDSKDGMRVIG